MRIVLPCMLCLFLYVSLACRGADVVPRDWFVETWQTEEGLPDNAIGALAQTPDGYIWVATLSGLVRFDSQRFRPFTPANAPGLHSPQVRGLFVDRAGALWVGAGRGGLSVWRNGTFSAITTAQGLSPHIVQAVAQDRDGSIRTTSWTTPLIHRIESGSLSSTPRPDAQLGNVSHHWATDRAGGLWLAGDDTLLSVRGDELRPVWRSPAGNVCIAARAAGGIWVAAGGLLWRWEEGLAIPETIVMPEAKALAMLEDRHGTLWIGTDGKGLFRIEGDTARHVDGSHPQIRALLEDHEGNIWAGTGGGGLSRVRERQFAILDRRRGLERDAVLSLCEDAGGALWCVTQGGALTRLPPGSLEAQLIPDPPRLATSVCATPDRSVWVGTDGNGVSRLKEGKWTSYRLADGLADDFAPMLFAGSRGDLWVGAAEGLARWEGEQFRVVARKDTLGDGVRSLAEGADGALWVGTGDGRLHRFAGNERQDFGVEHGLPGAVIRCLLPLADGTLWLGTDGGGLCKWQANKATVFTIENGLLEDAITQLQQDSEGHFWCGSPRGLFRVSRRELEDVAAGSRAKVQSTYFGRSDGMPNFRYATEFHPRSARRADGSLLFSTQNGIVVSHARWLVPNPAPPPVVIEAMRVDGRIARTPSVPVGSRSIEFDFAALSFAAPDKVRVLYKVEGLDEGWRDAGSARTARYLRPPPGEHRFQLIAANNDGVWNEVGATLDFKVARPFWQQPWVIAMALLGSATVIAATVRRVAVVRMERKLARLQQRHAIEKERTRIARDMHDSVGTSLTQIALLCELAQREATDPLKMRSRMQSVTATARQVVRALDEIVWSVNPRNDDLPHLIDYVSQFATEFLRDANIVCIQEVPAVPPERPIPAEARHHLFLAVKEALNNAVRHSGATEVRFAMKTSEDSLCITIADNGRGLSSANDAAGGNGLQNLRARMTELGGTCEIHSSPGSGLRIVLEAPLSDTAD